MQPKYILNDNTHVVETVRRSDDITIEVDGHALDARIHWRDAHQCELTINGVAREVYAAQDDSKIFLHLDGKTFQLDVVDEFGDADEGGAGSGRIKAPMPGVMIESYVREGDQVEEGQALLLIESMKLQTEIKASLAGVVSKIGFAAGASFEKGAVLADVSAPDDEG